MKLNLGCGNKIRKGFIGVDIHKCAAAQIVTDLRLGLPFKDACVHQVLMDNTIEHIPDISAMMKEIHRICIKGATLTIRTPHFASASSWIDPTHTHHLSCFSMDHFEKNEAAHYTGGGFRVVERKLSFGGILGNIGKIIYRISPKSYEKKWCFIFRPGTITFVLQTV